MASKSKHKLTAWTEIEEEWLNPKVSRRMIVGENAMLARLVLKKGSFVPPHKHASEQLSSVLTGSLEFRIGRKSILVGPGQVLVIPPNAVHSALALEDTDAIDAFSPLREDWLSGDDSYLRTGKSSMRKGR
ncbi:MAG: cupin domain-containing protein [Thaumarchaeota archaeon]|nr:cupin domain-containing protein [Nitrososphaerota archaeon]